MSNLRLLQKSRVLDFASAITQYNRIRRNLLQKFYIKKVFLQEPHLSKKIDFIRVSCKNTPFIAKLVFCSLFMINISSCSIKELVLKNNDDPFNKVLSSCYIPDKVTTEINSENTAVRLRWSNVNNADYYIVYRSVNNEKSFGFLGEAAQNNYEDTGVKIGETYYYKVQSVLTTGSKSEQSSCVSGALALPVPTAPQNITITKGSYLDKIQLGWENGESSVKTTIYRATDQDGKFELIATSDTLSYSDTSCDKNRVYYYKLQNTNQYGVPGDLTGSIFGYTGTAKAIELSKDTEISLIGNSSNWYNINLLHENYDFNVSLDTTSTLFASIFINDKPAIEFNSGTIYPFSTEQETAVTIKISNPESAALSAVLRIDPVLKPVTGLSCTQGGSTINLTFQTVYYADSYTILRTDSESGTYQSVGTTSTGEYQDLDESLVSNQKYYYKVKYSYSNLESSLSESAAGYYKRSNSNILPPALTDTTPPGKCVIDFDNIASTGFTVKWTETTDDYSEAEDISYTLTYKEGVVTIETIDDALSLTPLLTDSKGIFTYDITGLTKDTNYTFAIINTDEAGNKCFTKSTVKTLSDFDETLVMVKVPSITNFSMGHEIYGGIVHTVPAIDSFYIGRFEVTYQLWKTVYDWAISDERGEKKYTFAEKGIEGSTGVAGGDLSENANHPVLKISPCTAIAWCNAYTEWSNATKGTNFTVVYYKDTEKTTVYRDCKTGEINIINSMVDWDASGYRLPTEAEWEAASRYKDTTSWRSGEYCSGVDSDAAHEAANEYTWNQYNSEGKTHPIGTKKPNDLGIYDMSGNAKEICWDQKDTSDYTNASPFTDPNPKGLPAASYCRVVRGGAYMGDQNFLRTSKRDSISNTTASAYNGIRIVRKGE